MEIIANAAVTLRSFVGGVIENSGSFSKECIPVILNNSSPVGKILNNEATFENTRKSNKVPK